MTPLEIIKAISSYTDDTKINAFIEIVKAELINICKLTAYDIELDSILAEMVVIKLNKMGNEGIASANMNGISESYLDDYPLSITKKLKKWTNKVVMH